MGKHSKFDAIIAGAGHNGLITVANLAKAGLKVLIVEKYEYIGGAVVSREFHEGWTYSICSYVCSQQCFATSERWGVVMFETKQTTTMGLILRTIFIGDLGYELWVDWAKGQALWGSLVGCRRSLGTACYRVRGAQYLSDRGRVHRRSPIELGFDKMTAWDKGHFNGRRALMKQRDNGGRYHLRKIDIGGFKLADGSLLYHRKRKEVGHVTSGVWSPTTKRNIASAEFKSPFGELRTSDLGGNLCVRGRCFG